MPAWASLAEARRQDDLMGFRHNEEYWMLSGLGLFLGVLCAGPLPVPTATPTGSGSNSVGMGGALFYGLLLLGTILFLAAFFYGRRKGL